MSKTKVQVASEGNERKGGVTDAELIQSINDIQAWFRRQPNYKIKSINDDNGRKIEWESVEKIVGHSLPATLKLFHSTVTESFYLLEHPVLSLDQALELLEEVGNKNRNWKEEYFPLAGDVTSSSLLVINTRNHSLVEWNSDDNDDDDDVVVAVSWLSYLEEYRDKLLENHFEFIDDGVGVVEKLCSSSQQQQQQQHRGHK